jgi:MarR family transcriptional regulator, negative regulator of the multidrug operon emrRAB
VQTAYMQSARRDRVANMFGGLSVAIGDSVTASSREAALVALDSHPDVSVVHLSRALGRSHSATVRLVDGLARAGLVTRAVGEDPRAVALRLTDIGEAAAAGVRRARAACLDRLVAVLSDEDVAAVEPVLERLLAASARDRDSRWRICRLCEEPRCESTIQPCPVDAAAPR